jgi:hypothetical protein
MITLSDINDDLPGLDRLLKHRGYENCGKKPGIQRVKRQSNGSQNQFGE